MLIVTRGALIGHQSNSISPYSCRHMQFAKHFRQHKERVEVLRDRPEDLLSMPPTLYSSGFHEFATPSPSAEALHQSDVGAKS